MFEVQPLGTGWTTVALRARPLWPAARVGGVRLAAGAAMPPGGRPRCESAGSPVRAAFSHHDPYFLYQGQDSSSRPQSDFFLGAFSYYEWRRTFSESSEVRPRVRQRGAA